MGNFIYFPTFHALSDTNSISLTSPIYTINFLASAFKDEHSLWWRQPLLRIMGLHEAY